MPTLRYEQDGIGMGGGGRLGSSIGRNIRSMKGLFGFLLCAERNLGPPPPTRDNMVPYGVCIFQTRNSSAARAAAALGASSEATTGDGGGGVGDAQKSERSFLSFSGYKISYYLRHVNTKKAEAMEDLLAIIYYRVNGGVSRPDLSRTFITLR